MTVPMIVLLGTDSTLLPVLYDLATTGSYRALCCRPQDAADAHRVVKRARAALAILDLEATRRVNGLVLLRHLWADVDTTCIPVIVVTGATDALPMDADLLRTTHCRVLRKPVDTRELVQAIAGALGSSPATPSVVAAGHGPDQAGRDVPVAAVAPARVPGMAPVKTDMERDHRATWEPDGY